MMTIINMIIALPNLVVGLTKFFTELNGLIKVLRATPQENHEKIMDAVQTEADKFKKDGRPAQ